MPETFRSFGLIAKEKTCLPQVIKEVFLEWNLNPSGRFARNVGLHQEEILDLDLIFSVTTFIAEELLSMGFKGRIVDLELEAALLGIELRDPQLMPRRQCAFELAKYVKVAYSSLQKLGFIQNSKIVKGLIPDKESSIPAALDLALATRNKNSVVIYADLVSPRNDLVLGRLGSSIKYSFNGSIFEMLPAALGISTDVFVPAHSVMSPPSIYLGTLWTDFLWKIDAVEITLITPPQNNGLGMAAESYLAALPATEIVIVA